MTHGKACVCPSCMNMPSAEKAGSMSDFEQRLQRMADDEQDQVKMLGDRIGYGRVIQLCEELWRPPSESWTVLERKQLAAEVERLRAENEAALEYDKSMRRQNSELRQQVAKLEAKNAELRELVRTHESLAKVASVTASVGERLEADQESEVEALKAENAELRANHDSSPCAGCIAVADQNDALKATLDWFEALVQSLRKQPDPWLEEWLREYDREHPRPGSEW